MARPRLISPHPVTIGDAVRNALEAQGVPVQVADWLAPALLEIDGAAEGLRLSESPNQLLLHVLVPELGQALETAGDLSAGILVVLDILALNRLQAPWEPPNEEQKRVLEALRRFVQRCRAQGLELGAGFRRAVPLRPSTDPAGTLWFARRMLACQAISPAELVDIEKVRSLGDLPDWSDLQRSYQGRTDHITDPTSLPFWLELTGPVAVVPLIQDAAAHANEQFARFSRGVAYALGVWPRMDRHEHPESFAERGEHFAQVTRAICVELERRVVSGDASEELRAVWLRYAWMASDASDDWVSEERRERLLRAAADELGRLRPSLRRASTEDGELICRLEPHIRSCIFVLFTLGTLWQATKPLLLAFRALGTRAVGHDLRYWNTARPDDPPKPWEVFPRSLMYLLHHYMSDEQRDDARLEELRSSFAAFCLERLKTRQRKVTPPVVDTDLFEPDPAWREGFIQAVRALRINPGGKGHHILHWSSQHDPDQAVRDLAAAAYTELRHQPRLPQGESPRRVVFEAFWWLRQAHLSSLGEPFDEAGASRAREEEVRRTTEAESV